MDRGVRYLPPATPCHYLADQMWRLEYRVVVDLSRAEYHTLVQQGWRRFGNMLFRPRCPQCTACQPIRVLTGSFKPDRSQRRVEKANADTRLVIGAPSVDDTRLDLYERHHRHHAQQKGWRQPDVNDGQQHIYSMIVGPLAVSEWAYYRDDKLVAVSYIDNLPDGYSGMYFFHDPDYRKLSLGTWICMSLIYEAAKQSLPYVYMGYYIKGCRSMEYKGRFAPNQILLPNGKWQDFIS